LKQYFIKIGRQFIPVDEKVYRAYYQPVWREEKRAEVREEKEISYDFMAENGIEPEDKNRERVDTIVTERLFTEKYSEYLHSALRELDEDEKFLIDEIFFKGISERELSGETGIPRKTIAYRREKILEKLKKIIEKF
jgi:RNA polymerase sigma factor (sigma-70 family)